MARQADHGVIAERLRKIGNEAFAEIDHFFAQPKREPAKRFLQNPYHSVVQVPAKKEINHKEAALKYGGQIYIDYTRIKKVY